VEAKVQALLETVDKNLPSKDKTMWRTEINKFLETEKGLWNWWHSKWMPQAPSKATIGTFDTFN
jgi:hypothetical protein